MDSSRKNNTQDNSYHIYDGNSGNDGDKIAPPKASNSMHAASLRPSASRSFVASPYSKTWELLEMEGHDDDIGNDIDHRERTTPRNGNGGLRHSLKRAPDSLLARSSITSSSPPAFDLTPTAANNAASLNSVASSKGSSIYGTKNTKGSLEDDDPSNSAANIIDHLTISSSSVSAHSFAKASGRRMISATGGVARSIGIMDSSKINGDGESATHSFPTPGKFSNQTRSIKSSTSMEGWQQPHLYSHLPLSKPAASALLQEPGEPQRDWTKLNESYDHPMRKAPPKNDEDYDYDNEGIEKGKEDSVVNNNGRDMHGVERSLNRDYNDLSLATDSDTSIDQDDFIPLAKEHTSALRLASDANEIKASYIRNLTECCKKYQVTLQGKLSEFFQENTDATDHLMELFGLSDEICAAIEAGEEALKCEEERTKKKKVAEGPTIELLEANRDVFSLICMLRAANEKRMLAALALMRFAKDDQVLRNEIISSGGIHSFLTLFQQTRGITRELKVVASLAVAHILPSYVVSSQTTSSIGLKLVECLHFLAKSNPVSPNGIVITVEEMCKAASVGVNVLWINSIQPLIALKKVKEECSSSPPSLRPGKTVRYGRLRSRTG